MPRQVAAHDDDGPLSGGGVPRLAARDRPGVQPHPGLDRLDSDWSMRRSSRPSARRGEGRTPLAPVMPYGWLHDMSDVMPCRRANLRTLPPIHNDVVQRPSIWFSWGSCSPRPSAGGPVAPSRGPTAIYGGVPRAACIAVRGPAIPASGLQSKPDRLGSSPATRIPSKEFPQPSLPPDNATGSAAGGADFVGRSDVG